jgi:para-nitrobenzyl esterase
VARFSRAFHTLSRRSLIRDGAGMPGEAWTGVRDGVQFGRRVRTECDVGTSQGRERGLPLHQRVDARAASSATEAGDGLDSRRWQCGRFGNENGESLMRHGVVLVSFNYRLALFGFLAHPALTAETPDHTAGNYA